MGMAMREDRARQAQQQAAQEGGPGAEMVTVPLAALRALVEAVRELDGQVSDDQGIHGERRERYDAEVREMVDALGVEGL